ncbi:MAG: type VI secretion system baseplate subunit TssE [Oceanospirillaceae bacterium]|nr:type VI secretion system baseplate subunit TssE [Oceanospirillaceae bacterium]
MFEYSLLQRIAMGDEGANQSLDIGADKLKRSVQLHLQNMFNVRQGSVPTSLDYGLPDFNDLDISSGYATAVSEVRKAIKLSLERYEPRLTSVKVRHIWDEDNQLELRYEITARMNIKDKNVRVRFETLMADEKFFRVTS